MAIPWAPYNRYAYLPNRSVEGAVALGALSTNILYSQPGRRRGEGVWGYLYDRAIAKSREFAIKAKQASRADGIPRLTTCYARTELAHIRLGEAPWEYVARASWQSAVEAFSRMGSMNVRMLITTVEGDGVGGKLNIEPSALGQFPETARRMWPETQPGEDWPALYSGRPNWNEELGVWDVIYYSMILDLRKPGVADYVAEENLRTAQEGNCDSLIVSSKFGVHGAPNLTLGYDLEESGAPKGAAFTDTPYAEGEYEQWASYVFRAYVNAGYTIVASSTGNHLHERSGDARWSRFEPDVRAALLGEADVGGWTQVAGT